MLLNERYIGTVHWNASKWEKDPDSGIRTRRERPPSEWITYQDKSLRIVSDNLWAREMQQHYDERHRLSEARSVPYPHELHELDARLVRLRVRLNCTSDRSPKVSTATRERR